MTDWGEGDNASKYEELNPGMLAMRQGNEINAKLATDLIAYKYVERKQIREVKMGSASWEKPQQSWPS